MKSEGYGQGYRYVHDDPDASREMTCLPDTLRGREYIKLDEPDRPVSPS
jgi:putative ATPase